MSVEGRIIVEALFHDRDGTASLNALSLSDVTNVASGVVAYLSKTASVGTISLPTNQYRDASGQVAYPSAATLLVFKHTGDCIVTQPDENGELYTRVVPQSGKAMAIPISPDYTVNVQTLSTGTYTCIIYGES